jgi:hypothetical protein
MAANRWRPEAADNIWGFPNQQDEIWNSLVLGHKIPGDGFSDLNEAHIQAVLNFHATKLMEEELQEIAALRYLS